MTPEQNQQDNSQAELQPLSKHSYPLWIKCFGLFSLLIWISSTALFMSNQFPIHHALNMRIAKAQQYFNDKDYAQAGNIYQNLVNTYPQFKQGKTRLAQIFFALSDNNEDFFFAGMHYLKGQQYSQTELDEIDRFVPENYKETFKSSFGKA